MDAFHKNFVVLPAAESPLQSAQGFVVSLQKPDDGGLCPIFSFIDPSAGMFVWSKFYFDGVSRFLELEGEKDVQDPEQAFAHELWMEMVEERVLLTPGSYYHPWQGPEKLTTKARGADPRTAAFRFSFATPTVSLEGNRRLHHRYWLMQDTGESDSRRNQSAMYSIIKALGLIVMRCREVYCLACQTLKLSICTRERFHASVGGDSVLARMLCSREHMPWHGLRSQILEQRRL